MDSSFVGEPGGHGIIRRNRVAILLAFCIVAAAIRSPMAYHGGIWADEAFFLLVVGAPSWSAMLQFLHYHESHPPLFYALMRLWMWVTGGGDLMAMLLPIAIGVAIVPAIFVVGKRLVSERVGLIAAALAAISPTLSEHSSQLRPYGLLPLLTLVSCFALVVAIQEGGIRRWAAYAGTTILLLYTHNWSWLIADGQLVAVVVLLPGRHGGDRGRLIKGWTGAWLVIGIAYLPWLPALLFQLAHAGHGPLVVKDFWQSVELALLAVPASVVMVLFGDALGNSLLPSVVGLLAVIVAGSIAVAQIVRGRSDPLVAGSARDQIAMRVFLIVPATAIAGAVAFSSRSDLLLPRCLAMLTPLVLVLLARRLDRQMSQHENRMRARFAFGILASAAVVSAMSVADLLGGTRSNARELAGFISDQVQPTDLVIIAPEWYSPVFNHYFTGSADQIDYPHPGRSGMIDFSHVFERVSAPGPLARIRSQIDEASRARRRVWFVTSSDYVRPLDEQEVENATRYRLATAFSRIRVHQITEALKRDFGPPDIAFFANGRRPRQDALVAYLFSPAESTDPNPSPARSQ